MGKKLEAARSELRMAEQAIRDMRVAKDLDALDRAWKDFLGRLTRIWNKTEAALKGDPKYYDSARYKNANRLRKDDELLQYLAKARDADEHTVGDVTMKIPAGLQIDAAIPGGKIMIRNLEINGRQVKVDAPGAKVTFRPSEVWPLPATTRGRTYHPPSSHAGESLEQSIFVYADKGLAFYAAFIEGLAGDGWDVDSK
jgi:hypothetical protein